MAYSIEFTGDGLGVIHVASGPVTADDLIAGCAAIATDATRASKLRYVLVDLTAASDVVVSTDLMESVAAQCLRTAVVAPTLAVAVIAPAPHVFGVARMWQALSERTGWRTLVAHARAEAFQWLRDVLPALSQRSE